MKCPLAINEQMILDSYPCIRNASLCSWKFSLLHFCFEFSLGKVGSLLQTSISIPHLTSWMFYEKYKCSLMPWFLFLSREISELFNKSLRNHVPLPFAPAKSSVVTAHTLKAQCCSCLHPLASTICHACPHPPTLGFGPCPYPPAFNHFSAQLTWSMPTTPQWHNVTVSITWH